MAQYDGSIRINTQINTDGFKDGEKQIESESRRVTKSVSNSTQEAEKQVENLGRVFSETTIKIAELQTKMDLLKNQKIPTEEYKEVQKQIESTQKSINNLIERQEKFLATGGKETSSTYKRMQYDLDELKSSLPYLQGELQDLVDAGKAFTLGSDTEKFSKYETQLAKLREQEAEEQRLAQIKFNATVSDQKIIDLLERRKQLITEIKDMEAAGVGLGYKQYEDANRELKEINGKIKDYQKNLESVPEKFEKMRKSANKAFTAVSSGTKKSSGLLSTFSSRLKGIALSLLIFNWISKAFNAMISGMKKGFENLAGYSDSYAQSVQSMKNAMSTLGNQFAAAFAPIVQMVIPWLNSLIGVITTAVTYVSQFIAVLSGKSTFTKAKKVQDDYNKSLGGTAKAADKARGALAKFDDLDVLEKKQEDAGGGSADSNAGADMFEEVEVDNEIINFWQKIQEAIRPIIEYAQQLKDIFSKGFFDGLGDWESRFESIKVSIAFIKESLKNIFLDPEVLGSADGWAQTVSYSLGSIAGSMSSIGLTIATNLLGGMSVYLEGNKDRIKGYMISMFDISADVYSLFAELFDSIDYVFEAFATEQGQQLTANIIGIFTNSFMGITELASKLFRDIASIIILPFVENKEAFRTALEGFLSVLSEVTGTIKKGIDETFNKLNEVYDEHLKPFFDSIATGLSDTAGKFLEFWNENVQPVLNKWAEKFDEVWKEYLQPTLNKFIGLFGKVADLLKAVWENVLKPLIDWVIKNVLPVVLPIIEGVGNAFLTVFGTISEVVGDVIDVIGGIIDFLTGVFSGDWEKAWDGIVDAFKGIFNLIPTIVEGVINAAIDIINGIIGGINWATDYIGIPAIPEIPPVELARLATGAVIRGGNPFMAILGDQPAGQTNIEAPLDTIRQAVREELTGMNLGNAGSGQTRVVLNINGIDVGEAMLDDLFSVMSRRGYDVSVLGVT